MPMIWITIAGHKIIVRRAKDGDEFQTLDGQIRKLDSQVLMICDARKRSRHRWYYGRRKQQDHRRCAHRFIRGCNIQRSPTSGNPQRESVCVPRLPVFSKKVWIPVNAEAAIDRACQLIEELGCGEVVGGMVDVCGADQAPAQNPV